MSTQRACQARDIPSLGGLSVLIAEDEYFIANDLARAVHRLGGQAVGPASTAEEALELLAGATVHVGIIDINLRGFMAFPLVDEMIRCKIPVVFATGYTTEIIPPGYRHLPRWVKPYMPLAVAYGLRPYAVKMRCAG